MELSCNNNVLYKAQELEQQSRSYKFICNKIEKINIASYSVVNQIYGVSFYFPEKNIVLGKKKIFVLMPSSISYFSKGEPLCLNMRLSYRGVEYNLLYLYALSVAKKYIPDFIYNCLYPRDLLKCRHFALGFALGAFKPKDINSMDKLKANKFLQATLNSVGKNLDILCTKNYPIITLHIKILFLNILTLNPENINNIINILYTINAKKTKDVIKIEKLFTDKLDQKTQRLTDISPELFSEIANNYLLRIAIFTEKPWNIRLNLLNQHKDDIAKIYQTMLELSDTEIRRTLECCSCSINNFSDVLFQICYSLQKSEKNEINYLWITATHTMAFKFNVTKGGIKISFYDPGKDTSRLKKIIVSSINDITKLYMNDFIEDKLQLSYKIKLDSKNSNLLHTSFFTLVNLDEDEYNNYCSADVIDFIKSNRNHKKMTKSTNTASIVDLTDI